MQRNRIALAGLFWLLALSGVGSAEQRLCSAGSNDGRACSAAADCPGGACVVARAVCDGGPDDGFDCDCPGSQCSTAVPCSRDLELGTCEGGPNRGQCCDPNFNCRSAAPCQATQRLCLSGTAKGFPCLRDSHCSGAVCWATGRQCTEDAFPCADDSDCLSGTCQGAGVFPTPTVTPTHRCTGDCDGDGEVTIDNLLLMVNVALDSSPLAQCAAGDANGDGRITIDEIITAVGFALTGCGA